MREDTVNKIKELLEEEMNDTNDRIIKILEEERESNNELRTIVMNTLKLVNQLMENKTEDVELIDIPEQLELEKDKIITETHNTTDCEQNKEQESKYTFIGDELERFKIYEKNIKAICSFITRLSNNPRHNSIKNVMKCLVEKLKVKYGICWKQEFLDFEKEYETKPFGYMEVLFYLENKNTACKNMGLTILLSLIDDEKLLNKTKIKGLVTPVNNIDEIVKTNEIIIRETGLTNANGASFFKRLFNFTDVFTNIDWEEYKRKYREKKQLAKSKKVSKIEILKEFEELYPVYIKAYNKFIYYNYEQA